METRVVLMSILISMSFLAGCSQKQKGVVTVVNDSGEDLTYWVYVQVNPVSTRCFFKSPFYVLKADSSVDVDLRGHYSPDNSVEVTYWFVKDKSDSLALARGWRRLTVPVEELDNNGWAPLRISKSAVEGP